MTVVRRLARPLLASGFVVGGISGLKNAEALAGKAKPVTDRVAPVVQQKVPSFPSDPQTLVRINAITQVVAGGLLVANKAPRLSSAVLAGTLVPTTIAGHAFWNESDPAARRTQVVQFAKNLSMLGGLILAAVDTEGRPGLAWRAQHAGRDVQRSGRTLKREAKRMRKEVALQARLAAAKAT